MSGDEPGGSTGIAVLLSFPFRTPPYPPYTPGTLRYPPPAPASREANYLIPIYINTYFPLPCWGDSLIGYILEYRYVSPEGGVTRLRVSYRSRVYLGMYQQGRQGTPTIIPPYTLVTTPCRGNTSLTLYCMEYILVIHH